MPEFDNPPVSEVAISIEFSPIENWGPNQALLYSKLVQEEYPKLELKLPLPSQIEKFEGDNWQPLQVRFEAVGNDEHRFWYLSDNSVWIIQIQKDRFVINWRQVKGDEKYPRYLTGLRPCFEKEFSRFQNFFEQNGLGNIDVKQCEVTYVNDILKGDSWNTLPEAMSLITPLAGGYTGQYLPAPESIACLGTFLFHDERGRLHYSVNRVIRQFDMKEAIQMRLVARCRPQSSANADVLASLDMAREWVVRGFAELTTDKAHTIWGRKQ